MSRYYTGVGSRETPADVLLTMKSMAADLAFDGYTVRSGGADGADSAFVAGAAQACGLYEIFTPWMGFHDDGIDLDSLPQGLVRCATDIASTIHPAWDRCSQGAQKLHTRNVFQVLGRDLETPSEFVVFWARRKKSYDPEVKGGTRTAVEIARRHNIPTINLCPA